MLRTLASRWNKEKFRCYEAQIEESEKAGVTGNPIRAYTDPGGSDPLAKSIRRIIFTSGSDPPPDQFYQRIRSFAAKTIRLCCKSSVKKNH